MLSSSQKCLSVLNHYGLLLILCTTLCSIKTEAFRFIIITVYDPVQYQEGSIQVYYYNCVRPCIVSRGKHPGLLLLLCMPLYSIKMEASRFTIEKEYQLGTFYGILMGITDRQMDRYKQLAYEYVEDIGRHFDG